MDLTNKTISIVSMATNNMAQTTAVTVQLSSEIAPSVFQIDSSFQLNFDQAYLDINDANLMSNVISTLEALP